MKQLIIQLQATQEADEAALGRAINNPDIYQPVYEDARRVLVRRFPYAAYFLSEADTVRVIAILRQSRNPDVWQSRLP